MSWRGVQLGLLILAIGLAGVGGVSYFHPFHVRVWDGYDTKLLLTLADGNIRVVRLVGHFVAPYTGETPLDEFARLFSVVAPTELAWDRRTLSLRDGATSDILLVGCTFVVPLVLYVGLAFVIHVVRKPRWQVRMLLRELVWPSDCVRSSVVSRVARRLLVTILCLGGAGTTVLWLVSCKSGATGYAQHSFWHGLITGLRSPQSLGVSPGSFCRAPLYSLRVEGGLVRAWYCTCRRTGTTVNREFEVAGIHWARRVEPVLMDYYQQTARTEEDKEILRTTEMVSMRMELPLGYPVFLFWAWPVVAFWRGPWRRSGRRAEGFCIRCGYNLTGLVEPRCPECGTPLLPDQVEAMQGASSPELTTYAGLR